ncbi:hypothetical protein AMS68_007282 [Peltaster fructicola]|uniref:DNA-directed RNA polymerase III subunit RPC3 n=1 Tax=Peltaster fructicola TaxID=286661 RepID=A0A6H0Y4B0_9PEZI|nr:hypothetical protein AMS68_007282 [Peltaster fructicola]
MAQHLVELCGILVEESFGDTAALIWSHLAQRGRTQFAQLASVTKVKADRLAQLLPILILNRTIVYYVDQEFDVAWYSVDLEGSYNLLRMSRLGEIVKERCGKDAAHLINNMAQLGHVTVGELISAYGLDQEQQTTSAGVQKNGHSNGSMSNGTHANGRITESNSKSNRTNGADAAAVESTQTNGDHPGQAHRDLTPIQTLDQLYATLHILMQAGFLIKANPRFFQTDYDLHQAMARQVQEEQFADGKITGPKASKEYNTAMRKRKRQQREDEYNNDDILGEDIRSSNKRQKTSGSLSNGHKHHLGDDMILTINMRKYVVALRSKSCAKEVITLMGQSSGAVYNVLLQALEKQIPEITYDQRLVEDTKGDEDEDHDMELPRATVIDLYNMIDRSTDFTSSLKVSAKDLPAPADNKPAFRQVKEDFSAIGIKPEPESDDDAAPELDSFTNRTKICDLLERHLHSIEEHSMQFCQREGLGRPSIWSVDFSDLTDLLIQAEIDNSIAARFGKESTRLVRLLRDKGKLEEKEISGFAFMRVDQIQLILTELYANGYVEAQEIAKDSTRQPSKALYLWYFDVPKVQRMIITQCYQSMSRLYQRLATERERFKTVIGKAQRLAEAKFFGDHYFAAHNDDDDEEQEEEREGEGNEQEASETTKPVRFILGPTGLWKSEAMSAIEKKQISEWKAIESNYIAQIMRLDDIILILRDFSGQYTMASA